MAIKTYNDQVVEHITFLRAEGLDVDVLEIGATHMIRCREIGEKSGRPAGELAYKTMQNQLQNGYVGLVTKCRGKNGWQPPFSTYGLGPDGDDALPVIVKEAPGQQAQNDLQKHEEAARKATVFWEYSDITGSSDYLDSKGVDYYGIRFRNNEYGRVAVIPMRDIDGKLWSYQLLNPKTDAKPKNKHFATGARADNLFHFLKPVIDGKPFLVAESYVTAATVLELTGLSSVCIFSSIYFESSSLILRKRFPNSKMILVSDNDRHLANNIGILKAQAAQEALKENVLIAAPDFGIIAPSKDASDWNDLVRLRGVAEAKRQLNFLGIVQE